MGSVGVGKTRLVCSILRAYTLEHQIPCLFKEFSSLLSEIKGGYDRGLSESLVLEKISDIEILVIDELGKGRKTDWEVAILDSIISQRYNMNRTTIFTTNYYDEKFIGTASKSHARKVSQSEDKEVEETPELIANRTSPRIYSRLKEMCAFTYIDAGDFRIKNT